MFKCISGLNLLELTLMAKSIQACHHI